jgi:putative transcriptional regulator
MSLRRQPSEERLLAFTAGTLSYPEAVVVAAHLSMRPEMRAWTDLAAAVGGAVLEDQAPAPLGADTRDDVLARLDAPPLPTAEAPPKSADPTLPAPLDRFALGPWRWLGPGVRVRDVLGTRVGDCRVILLKIAPGQSTPRHTHHGVELTCVIDGAYATEDGVFSRGDFEEADATVMHQPKVISREPCLCVAALDGEIQLPGRLGRWLAPLVRI